MVDEARVTYKAIANFLDLTKKARAARAELEALQKTETKVNNASVAGSKKSAIAHREATKAIRSRTTSTKTFTASILAQNQALKENLSLTKSTGNAAQQAAAKVRVASMVTKDAAKDTAALAAESEKALSASNQAAAATGKLGGAAKDAGDKMRDAADGNKTWTQRLRDFMVEGKKVIPVTRRVENGATNVLNVFKRIGNYRPHIIPPFVALVPIIGGLLALLNPFVAILGAVGAAGFAAGSGIASMAGAVIGLVPMVAAAIGGIAGLLVAFKGVGSVLSKYGQGKEALAKPGAAGGSGRSAADEAYRNMKAQERLTDAQENAAEAQVRLNRARADAIRKLKQLSDAVQQNVLDEQDAAAALQLATENYYNVMADPGSTLGDKMSATNDLAQAEKDLADARSRSIEDQEELNKAQRAGVEGDEDVIAAQKNLRNSLRDVRDAQHDLTQEVDGGGGVGGGTVGAMDDFNTALAKLSPSARAVVLALIAMQGAWENVQRTVQEAFFSKIVNDMDDLAGMLPTIQNLLAKAAGAMGTFAHNFLMLVSSPEWKGDLSIISDQNVRLIDLAGAAVLNLLDAMKDLVIAAGPFAEDLLTSFEGLTGSFGRIVADARESGSLANWLDVVYKRIQQWWRIVKNVGQTLFNYGAASAPFGQWITDGLEDITEGWKKASEEARQPNSPFQDWLERIKPVLSELKGLLGDFFGWMSDTAMDQTSLDHALEILQTIRNELGPALAKIFDTLNESGIGESFISALSSIIESISTIMENGGAEGFKNFFTIVEGFFSLVADFTKTGAGRWFVSNFVPAMGVLAGITFVGKFTGLTSLLSALIAAAKAPKMLAFLSRLGGLGGLGAVGTAAAGAAVTSWANSAAGQAAADANSATGGTPAQAEAIKRGVQKNYISGNADQSTMAIPAPSTNADENLEELGKLGDGWASFFTDIDQGITKFRQDTAGMFVDADRNFTTFRQTTGAGVVEFFTVTIPNAFTGFVGWVNSWANPINAKMSSWWGTVLANWSTFWNVTLPGAWNGFVTWVNNWANPINAKMSAWWTTVWANWSRFWTVTLPGAFNGFVVWVNNWGNPINAKMSSWFGGILASWNKFWGVDLHAAFDGFVNWVNSWANPINAKLKGFFGDASKSVKTGADAMAAAGQGAGGAGGGGVALQRVKSILPRGLSVTSTYRTPAQNKAVGGVPNSYHTDKNNPAVDIAGPVGAMDAFAAQLRKMGGWRQLLYRVPGHYDHIHVAHKGGEVSSSWPRSPGDKHDERTTRLQVGEVVVPKSAVQNPFSGAGLTSPGAGTSAIGSSAAVRAMGQTMIDNSMHFGDIIIQNPAREAASESLPAAIRKVSYAGGRRKPSARLETAE
jgi:hypothetical protein